MTRAMPFGEVLEAADQLSPEDQQVLIAILHRRLTQAGRQRIVAEVQEARKNSRRVGVGLPPPTN